MRNLALATVCAVATTLIGANSVQAGSAGRRNTALATTALAVGAWSNHTGKAGRKNTAILATAGAAVAWSRYQSKKKLENRRGRLARVAWVPPRQARFDGDGCEHPGRHLGWCKQKKHHEHHHDDDD